LPSPRHWSWHWRVETIVMILVDSKELGCFWCFWCLFAPQVTSTNPHINPWVAITTTLRFLLAPSIGSSVMNTTTVFGGRGSIKHWDCRLSGFFGTIVPGFVLYCFGFGWEFMFSGPVIAGWFELGYRIPTADPYSSGLPLRQFLFGAFLWFVLLNTGLGRKKKPDSAPQFIPGFITPILLSVIIGIITLLLVISMGVVWSVTTPNDAQAQTAAAVTFLCIALLLSEIVFASFAGYQKCRRQEYISVWDDDTDVLSVQDRKACGIIPYAYVPAAVAPYNLFLVVIRFVIAIWLIWVIVLLLFVVIYDRILYP